MLRHVACAFPLAEAAGGDAGARRRLNATLCESLCLVVLPRDTLRRLLMLVLVMCRAQKKPMEDGFLEMAKEDDKFLLVEDEMLASMLMEMATGRTTTTATTTTTKTRSRRGP